VDSSRRLTGRYHKECFVCTDCRAPFPSGEFYVLDNLPFCAWDYHRRNKSLCNGCGIGVEGSYLQTEGEERGEEAKLWHLECFKCGKCGCILKGEYWELDGKALCMNDAFPGGFGFGRSDGREEGRDGMGTGLGGGLGGRNPERRRTKLLMGGGGLNLGWGGNGGGGGQNPYTNRILNASQRRW
jgi:hypothetical protein